MKLDYTLQIIGDRIRIYNTIATGLTILLMVFLAILIDIPPFPLALMGAALLFEILTIPKQVIPAHIRQYLMPYLSGVLLLGSGWIWVSLEGYSVYAIPIFILAGLFLLPATGRIDGQQFMALGGSLLLLVGIGMAIFGELFVGVTTIILTVIVLGQSIRETVTNATMK